MTDWNKLKVVELKAELSNRGLPQTGLKAALVARLEEADNRDGSESEATIQDDTKNDASFAASPDTISSNALPQSGLTSDDQAPSDENEKHSDWSHGKPSISGAAGDDASTTRVSAQPEASGEHVAGAQNSAEEVQPTTSISQFATQDPNLLPPNPSTPPSAKDVIEDKLKRKRRSQSPPPTSAEVVHKKLKTEGDLEVNDGISTTTADARWVEKHNAIDKEAINAEATEVEPVGQVSLEPTIVDTSKEEVLIESVPIDQPRAVNADLPDTPTKTRDSRFNGLFANVNNPQDSPDMMDGEPDRDISPATHPATSALYIKNLMRPLQGPLLHSHLVTLATAPGHDPDPGVILHFYLDPIKTHSFIIFANISAAARVRNALHDRVWPDEKNRKQLWVDFVPAEKAEEWMAEEMATNNGPRSQRKWEVDYRVDADRQVTVVLQEAISARPTQPVRQPSGPASQITPSRGFDPPSGPRGFVHPSPRPAMNVAKLNELYESTTTKPLLYFQPVSKELANKRLDNLDVALSKDAAAGRLIAGDSHRYTFENDSELVDRGPEIFSGIRPPQRFRGSRGGRGGGQPSYRDSYNGRDRRRDGGHGERRFDSYRDDRRDGRDDRRF